MISEENLAKLRRLMEARQKRDESKAQAEVDEKEYREIEADVFEALDEGPVDRLNNIDLGEPWGKVSFQARETTYGRVIDEDQAQEHFEQRQMVEEVSQPKFVMARINELVRAADESGDPMPPGLDFYKRRFVSITRQKS